jgi:sensor histidine kinase regulating citrate/malate metabolism
MKGHLYISVTNATLGRPQKNFLTTKLGSDHGFGLRRIDQLVAKYGGYVNRQTEEGIFATEIAIPFVLKI